ncbi:MAG TPA: glycosyl hydrolase 53 family protein [Draconibacterium sp.]|nr:glycosyl hydrolase 53 family protein [Draconibacterium sp.]
MLKFLILLFVIAATGLNLQAQNEDEFMIGADLSLVKKTLEYGGTYYVNNQPVDVFDAFKDGQYNYVRLRLFHSPNGVGPVVNSLDYTIDLAKTAKAKGFKLLLDFHYSDTWADPGQQTKPLAWKDLDFSTLSDSIYQYTKYVLNKFHAEGITPDMVQTGNEIHHGFLWPEGKAWNNGQPNYKNFTTLLKSAIKGVHDSQDGSNIPVMLHAATGGSYANSVGFIDSMEQYDVAFDLLGLSYYPCWHGTLADLENNISLLSAKYNYNIVVVETGYQGDGTPPDYCVLQDEEMPFPPTQQGQYDFLQALYKLLIEYEQVKGLFYWGGERIYAGDLGGSWSSLFQWQGNARKAIHAFETITSANEYETPKNNLIIYNPGTNRIKIDYVLDEKMSYTLSIFDLMGRQLRRYEVNKNDPNIELDLRLSGIYVIRFSKNNRMIQSEKKYFN